MCGLAQVWDRAIWPGREFTVSKVFKVALRFWHEGQDPDVVFDPVALDEPEGFEVSINSGVFRKATQTAWETRTWLEDNGFVYKGTMLGLRVNRPVWKGQYTMVFRPGVLS